MPFEPVDLSQLRHGNVSAPRYRKGSAIVDIEIEKLLHRVREETPDEDPVVLLAGRDGQFIVSWQMRAENLAEPMKGELTVRIETDVQEGRPITSLRELEGGDSET